MPKVQLIDRAGNWGSLGLSVAFYCAFFLMLIAGAAGPSPDLRETLANTAPLQVAACTGGPTYANCVATFRGVVTAVPYNQNLWLEFQMLRPEVRAPIPGGAALPTVPINWNQVFEVDVDGIGADGKVTVIADNKTHSARMACQPLSTSSRPATDAPCGKPVDEFPRAVFAQAFIGYPSYAVTLRMRDPLREFLDNGAQLTSGNVTFIVTAHKVAEKCVREGWWCGMRA
jgi:hypothetical protein